MHDCISVATVLLPVLPLWACSVARIKRAERVQDLSSINVRNCHLGQMKPQIGNRTLPSSSSATGCRKRVPVVRNELSETNKAPKRLMSFNLRYRCSLPVGRSITPVVEEVRRIAELLSGGCGSATDDHVSDVLATLCCAIRLQNELLIAHFGDRHGDKN